MVPTIGAEQTLKPARVAIALGSNLGDRNAALEHALKRLRAHPKIEVERQSGLLSNPAVGGEQGQSDYLNAAVTLRTALEPSALLAYMLEVEKEFGRDREREGHHGARTLDLDLLLYGDWIVSNDELSLPHPRMLERDFVLQPLAEIAPELVHPVAKCTVQQALQMLLKNQTSALRSNVQASLEATSS